MAVMTAQSLNTFGSETKRRQASDKTALLSWEFAAIAALLVLWLFCHPYFGNNRGSLIYTARALADLDPGGVGQDAMFRLDGQSAFTVFTPLFRDLTAALGGSAATMVAALSATVLFFAAVVALAWQMAEGRVRYAIVVFLATLPSYYGGYRIFRFAEASATPRPFAEALVLFGIAALLARRNGLAVVCMAAASLLHPIMALAGVAVAMVWLMLEDRRWIWVAVAGAAAILGAAAAGVAPFDRLFTTIDPEWRAILAERNPHLFPGLWMSGTYGRKIMEIAILLIAAPLVEPRTRNLLLAVLIAGFLGLGGAYAFGEKLGSLLIIQAQTWRMMWLVLVVCWAAAAICVAELWKRDNIARLTVLFLALAIVFQDFDWACGAFALTALVLNYGLPSENKAISERGFQFVFTFGAIVLLLGLGYAQWAQFSLLRHIPSDIVGELRRTLTISYDNTPLAVAAGVGVVAGWRLSSRAAISVAALVGALFAYVSWDRRTAESRYTDEKAPFADLRHITAPKAGEVYWINGVRETWSWIERPHWVSAIQGASIVFSRDLAMRYRDRAHRAINAGLADDEIVTPLTEPHLHDLPPIDRSRLKAFCAASDAPSWIVAPLLGDQRAEDGEIEWTAPVEKIEIIDNNGQIDWRRISRYALISCAK